MEVAIRQIGNSKGVVLPKPLLAQAGLHDQSTADIRVEGGVITLRRPSQLVRSGWSDAAKVISAHGEDTLLMGEFGNAQDAELVW